MVASSGLPPRVYLDATVYFQCIKQETGWELATQLLLASARDDIQVVASTFLLAEVCGWNGGVPDLGRQDQVADRFLEENPQILWVEVDRFVARESRRLSRLHRMRGGDAVHLATAVLHDCAYFMTDDTGYPARVGDTRVTRPQVIWQETFDDVQVEKASEDRAAAGRGERR